MSYFTAVLAREGEKWLARDTEVDDLESIQELAELLRMIENDDEPILLLVEREDAWWAVVRVDGDEDPRVFMSDVEGAASSPYGGILQVPEPPGAEAAQEGACGGDFDLLADLGSSPEELRRICEDELIPMDALAVIAEAGGFAEVLDSLR